MHTLLKTLLFVLSISFVMGVYTVAASAETVSSKSATVVRNGDTESVVANEEDGDSAEKAKEPKDEESLMRQEMEEKKKEREKTINDINTFLIESYKLKIDRILANLNMSIERVTNNNPVAQAKLLGKIRGDIDSKLQMINSKNISENRKKILFSVFSYIQESLDDKISQLVGQK